MGSRDWVEELEELAEMPWAGLEARRGSLALAEPGRRTCVTEDLPEEGC